MRDVLDDLEAEQQSLDDLVARLDPEAWDTPTPAAPWTIRDQISHLAFFDEMAALSASDPDAFGAEVGTILEIGIDDYMDRPLRRGRSMAPAALLTWWRTARAHLVAALAACDPDIRVPWYGPPMRARSSAVARLMEAWAHGQDVADALGIRREPTDRLFHVAGLGVRTFRFSFENRNLEAPPSRVRVALRGPSGAIRVWNDEAADSITGPVEDFCLVVAQRRHVDDTALVVEGPVAERWMEVAQVFAGPPGTGRAPAGT